MLGFLGAALGGTRARRVVVVEKRRVVGKEEVGEGRTRRPRRERREDMVWMWWFDDMGAGEWRLLRGLRDRGWDGKEGG